MLDQAPGRSCNLWRGVHEEAGFLAGTVVHWEPTLKQSIPERPYPLPEELQHVGNTHAGLC